ncbi:MAG: hypothetical protein LBM70_07285 [Victivallales bacterium]|jgi:hypothetical protein|nr:hypothetical protein [Victivallales bacterium]
MYQEINEFLSGSQSIYLFIAVLGSVILVVQFILSMSGLHAVDSEADFDVHVSDTADVAGLNFFSLKAIMAFITFFGWGGFFYSHLGIGGLGVAFVSGAIMMVLTALLLSLLLKLQQSGNITSKELIGKHGTVYLTVPPERAPGGIITVNLPGCTRQISVRAEIEFKTGESVVIAEDLGDGSYLVKRH